MTNYTASRLKSAIKAHLLQLAVDGKIPEESYLDSRETNEDVLTRCTVEQLVALNDNFVSKGSIFQILPCDPNDHLAISCFNMYIGIEKDGYTHS